MGGEKLYKSKQMSKYCRDRAFLSHCYHISKRILVNSRGCLSSVNPDLSQAGMLGRIGIRQEKGERGVHIFLQMLTDGSEIDTSHKCLPNEH